MIAFFNNRTRKILQIIFPVAIAIYLIFPLLAGYYAYPVAEYGIYKSFVSNFIDSLKQGVLPVWNEYVGCGHPAMYFGHYPISQNTLIYMLFGFSDFTYYLTRCLNLIILLFAFIYASKYLKFSYWIGLLGALCYFSINFVSRILIAETIGNLILVYPLLIVLIIKIIQEYKIKDILLFSLVYIFWLSGGHIIYVYMHLIMLSIIFWISAFVFYGYNTLKLKNLFKFISLYLLLFVLPFLAVLYQYYFVYDVISTSNRLKEGLIVSPLNPIAWKQLFASFKSSSYIFVALVMAALYGVMKLINIKLPNLKAKKINFFVSILLVSIVFLLSAFPKNTLNLLRVFGIKYSITTSDCKENYVLAKDSKENIITNGKFTNNVSGWVSHLVDLDKADDKQMQTSLKITSKENSTGYAYYIAETKPGKDYRISVSFKRGSASDGQVKIGNFTDDTSLYYSGVLSNTDWKKYDGSFRASSKATYITLVDLTSMKGESSYFTNVILQEIKPGILSDYIPLLKSKIFQISLFLFLLVNFLVLYKNKETNKVTLQFIFKYSAILIVYASLLSYYFFSPENIIGDVNGYDYDLFKELSALFQGVFIFFVLYSIRKLKNERVIKITVISLIALYLIRSHITIPLLRFFGIVWYAPRDGSIFSALFAILFMFGLKEFVSDYFHFLKNKDKELAVNIKNIFFIVLVMMMIVDSHHKFYKGPSHKFVYATRYPATPMEIWIANGRKELKSFKEKMLELDQKTSHFYRIFSGQNHYLYLAGYLQKYKIHEAAIYESSYSRDFYDFYNYTILGKEYVKNEELKNVMPYFLFTKHVHDGLGLKYKDILYRDFFLFEPREDSKYLKNQNIEFMWDLMQVKYLIAGPDLLDILSNFNTFKEYKLIENYPALPLKIYEITRPKNYSKLALYPLDNNESYPELVEKLNSRDINVLKGMYAKLVFLDQKTSNFNLLVQSSTNDSRYYEIESKKPAVLIDFESWNHNWHLAINSKKETLNKAFQIFKGIKIEPGLNRIKLSYRLKYFKELFFLSVLVILAYITLFAVSYRKKLKIPK